MGCIINSYINITIRVASTQALASMKAVETQTYRNAAAIQSANRASRVFASGGLALNPLTRFGNQIQWVGRQLQYNFTLPILLAGAASAKFALDNEKAFTRIAKVYGDFSMSAEVIQNELEALKGAFVELSNYYGVAQKDVLDIAAAWAAAGASGIALAKGVEQTLLTMVLGEMEAVEATNALIAIQAQYRMSSAMLSDTIAKLNIIENQTGITLSGLVIGFSKAAGAARSAGIDVDHLGAMLAALVPSAGSAATAGNALKTIISRLFAPTKQAADVLAEMGINVQDMSWKTLDGAQRVELFAKKFDQLSQSQQAFVASVIGSRWQVNKLIVLLDDINSGTGYYARSLASTADRTKYLQQAQKELNQVLTSNPQRLKQIWVMLQNAMADVIQPMIPVILMFADILRRWAESFMNLDPSVRKLILVLLVLLALVGPLMRYFGALSSLLGVIAQSFHFVTFHVFKLVWVFGKFIALGLVGILSGIGTALGAMVKPLLTVTILVSKVMIAAFLGLQFVIIRTAYLLRVAMYGAFVAFGGLMKAASPALVAIWRAVWIAVAGGATQIWAAMVKAWGAVLWAMQYFLIAFARSAGIVWRAAGLGWSVFLAATMASMQRIWAAGLFAMRYTLIAWAAATGAIWRGAYMIWTGMTLAFTKGIPALWAAMAVSLRAIGMGIVIFTSNLWKSIILVSTRGLATLGKLLVAGTAAIWTAISGPPGWVVLAVVAALTAAIGIAYAFRDKLIQVWHDLIQYTLDAWYALPEGIANAMSAVVQVVYKAVMAVWELLSYLNPFATHSPSLVSQVVKGMAIIREEFASIRDISPILNRAYRDIKRFNEATAEFRRGMDRLERREQLANILKVAPQAADEFRQLIRDLRELNRVADSLTRAIEAQSLVVDRWEKNLEDANRELDRQQDLLDIARDKADAYSTALSDAESRLSDWASTPIIGMRAMSDAIFANEMAQKSLRLEMLRMEEISGPLDDVRNRMAMLQGEIETARAAQTELRDLGAGSDILSFYDQQVDSLQAQQRQITQSTAAWDEMNAQLQKLERQGEILNLEESLKFDPLLRQIDQAANAMEEMPFDVIMAGIAASKAEIQMYSAALADATAEVVKQEQAVKQAEVARDAVQATYDAENAKLQELEAQYDAVALAIRDVETALNDMAAAAEESIRRAEEAARAAKEAAGAGGGAGGAASDFAGAAGGNFPIPGGTGAIGRDFPGIEDQSKLIEEYTAGLAERTSQLLESFDIFRPIRKMWKNFTDWFAETIAPWGEQVKDVFDKVFDNPKLAAAWDKVADFFGKLWDWGKKIYRLFDEDLREIWDAIKDAAVKAFEKIGPELAKFKELWEPLKEVIGDLWKNYIKPLGMFLGGAFLLVLKLVTSVLAEGLPAALDTVVEVIGDVIQIIRGFAELIMGILTLDFGMMWQGIKDIFSGGAQAIWHIFSGLVETVIGIVKGFVEGIVDFFVWLWEELVGGSIIPDMIADIVEWFAQLPLLVFDALVDLGKKMVERAVEAITAFWNAMKDIWVNIVTWIAGLPQAVWDSLTDLAGKLVSRAGEAFTAFFNKSKEIWTNIITWVLSLPQNVWDTLSELAGKVRNRAQEAFTAFFDKSKEVWVNIRDWILELPGKVWDNLSELPGKVKDRAKEAFVAFKDGIVDKWQDARDWLADLAEKVKNAIGDLSSTLVNKGSNLIGGLMDGVREYWGYGREWLWDLSEKIKNAVGDLSRTLYWAGRNVIDGFWDGMKDVWSSVTSWVRGLGSWLDMNKGPREKDLKLLVDNGKWIMTGLQTGLSSGFDSILDMVSTFGPQIASNLTASSTGGLAALQRTGAGAVASTVGYATLRADAATMRANTPVTSVTQNTTELHFHGDLSFPNVTDGGDAREFINNLKALAG